MNVVPNIYRHMDSDLCSTLPLSAASQNFVDAAISAVVEHCVCQLFILVKLAEFMTSDDSVHPGWEATH